MYRRNTKVNLHFAPLQRLPPTYLTELIDGLAKPPDTVRNMLQRLSDRIKELCRDVAQLYQALLDCLFHMFILQSTLHRDTIALVVDYTVKRAVHLDRINLQVQFLV